MHKDLRSKRASILHSEMPMNLITNSEPEMVQQDRTRNPATNATIDVDINPKKVKLAPPNKSNWNPRLRAALTVPLKEAGQPSFTKIMQFCKKDACSIYPRGSSICAPNAFFGTCFFGDKCTKKHLLATDAQVQPILTVLAEFIKYPSKIKAGSWNID